MKKTIISLSLIFAFVVSMTFSTTASNPAYKTSWTSGSINANYLDFAHTTHTFDVKIQPGIYKWELKTVKKNGKKGKVNFDIKELYKNGSNSKLTDKKYSPGTTKSGSITISDYNSKTTGTAGYAKLKVHIGRAGANTNVNYKITLTRTGSSPSGSGSSSSGSSSGSATNSVSPPQSTCTYSTLGSKNGKVYGQTTAKKTFDKKACIDVVTVEVKKLDGKARTTLSIYCTSDKSKVGTLLDSYEFPNGKSLKTFKKKYSNVEGKFIRIELHNRSVGNTFKWDACATQAIR